MKTLQELLRNSALASVLHIAPRVATVLLFIFIGRLAGPGQAGTFSLATTYLLITTTVMSGLDDLLIRQVVREPERAGNYLGNFLLLRVVLTVCVYATLFLIVQNGLHYSADTASPIIILTLSTVPDSLTLVAQSILLGQRRFAPPAAISGTVNLFKLLTGALILVSGGGLVEIAWLWFIGSTVGMLILLGIAVRQVGGLRHIHWLNFDPLKASWPMAMSFVAITILLAIDSQTDTILLSVFRNATEVGWYSAATTITFSLLILVQVYRFSVYPLMTRYAHNAPEKLDRLFQKSLYYMSVIAIPIVAGIFLLAPQIIDVIFKAEFSPAIPALQILVFSLLFFFLGEPCNRLMLVKDRQQVLVKMLIISASLNVILNLILIPPFGLTGSSLARTCSAGLFFLLNYGYIANQQFAKPNLAFFVRPFIAILVMSLAVIVIKSFGIIFEVVIGIIIYFVTLCLLDSVFRHDMLQIRQSLNTRFRLTG